MGAGRKRGRVRPGAHHTRRKALIVECPMPGPLALSQVFLAHAGAAGYAALYCWALVGLTGGDGLLGAVLMSPSLVVPGVLAWGLRPGGGRPC